MRARSLALAGALSLGLGPSIASAQEVDDWDEVDIVVPDMVYLDDQLAETEAGSEDLDLANVVLTAARATTTLQEAPAIVSVITQDQIQDRHLTTLQRAIDTVPGWLRYRANNGQFSIPLSRGTQQAALILRDGLSMFDPMFNIPVAGRPVPMELVKRIEVVTGPGGVLWGANSFLGLVNIITKTADDIDGVEAAIGAGGGPGDPNALRGYVMVGDTDFAGGTELLAHVGVQSYQSPYFSNPSFLFHSPSPQPNSLLLYGPFDTVDPARSLIINATLKLTKGPWTLEASVPYVQERHGLTFAGGLVNEDLQQDDLPECQGDFMGPPDAPPCIDRLKRGRKNSHEQTDRFASLTFRDRFGENQNGVAARSYLAQFRRGWNPLQVLVPIATILPGGLAFAADVRAYRAGGTIDFDSALGAKTLLLYGLEGFHEWVPDETDGSLQGGGIQTQFVGPYNLGLLPLPCPRSATWDEANRVPTDVEFVDGCPLTYLFDVNRTVLGGYTSLQWRPTDKLILDGGARVQAAPEALSERGYETQILGAAAIVYKLARHWHAKLNYTQGFRPPVFTNTDANGEAVSIDGEPTLEPERSQAGQVELNARIPGSRKIREYNFRADYSYTLLENLILFPKGFYENGGERGIHSAEMLGKIELVGGHRFEAGYTWLRILDDENGRVRSMPEHWFNLSFVGQLSEAVSFSVGTRVLGAFEDPNRIVEYRDIEFGENGAVSPAANSGQSVSVQPYEIVFDRAPPSAEVTLGARAALLEGDLVLDLSVYNAFDADNVQPDATGSFSPRLDVLPNPYERFHLFVSARYRP